MRYTKSGYYRAYHRQEAEQPEAHHGGPWFFGPRNFSTARPFSEGFAAEEEALKAAELYEAEIDDLTYLANQSET